MRKIILCFIFCTFSIKANSQNCNCDTGCLRRTDLKYSNYLNFSLQLEKAYCTINNKWGNVFNIQKPTQFTIFNYSTPNFFFPYPLCVTDSFNLFRSIYFNRAFSEKKGKMFIDMYVIEPNKDIDSVHFLLNTTLKSNKFSVFGNRISNKCTKFNPMYNKGDHYLITKFYDHILMFYIHVPYSDTKVEYSDYLELYNDITRIYSVN